MNKVWQVLFFFILADFVVVVNSEKKECTIVAEVMLICTRVPIDTVADNLSHHRGNVIIEELIIECDPQEKHFTLTMLDNVTNLPSSLQLIGCTFSLSSKARILASLKRLDIRYSNTSLPQFESYGQMEAFTFVNNSVLNPKDNAYHFVEFNFYDAEWCVFEVNETVSNCFCSPIDRQSTGGNESATLLQMSCFHTSAATILGIVATLSQQKKAVDELRLYSVPFKLDVPTHRDVYYRSIATIEYPLRSLEIHSCSTVGNNDDSSLALRELRSIYCQFWFKNNYNIESITISDCAQLDILQLLDYSPHRNIYEKFTMCMAPVRIGKKLTELNIHKNNISVEQLRNVFGNSIGARTIEELNFAHNMVPVLENEFGLIWGKSKLSSLNLSHCHINSIRNGAFDNLRYLEELDLHANNLSFIRPGILNQLGELTWLDLSHNRIYGVYSYEPHYPPIWPPDLLYLDLSHNILLAEGNPYEKGLPHVRMDANFFRGLENLLELSISSTGGPFESSLFAPLQNLNILDARNIKWTQLELESQTSNSVHYYGHDHLTSLRVLRIGNAIPWGSQLIGDPCRFFYGQKLLQTLEIANDAPFVIFGMVQWPYCETTRPLYNWYMKRRSRIQLENLENTWCRPLMEDGTEIMIDYWARNYNDSMDDLTSSSMSSDVTSDSVDQLPSQITIARFSPSNSVTSLVNMNDWSKIYIPVLFIILLTIIIVFIILPTSIFQHLFNERIVNHIKTRSNVPNRSLKRLKSLKREFYETTLFNGFAFINLATWQIEKVAWFLVILFFACIFAKDTTSLWVQFRYGDPQTSVSMVNAPTFVQQAFSICMPIPDQQLTIEPEDIRLLFTPVQCQGTNKQDQPDTLDLENRLAMLVALARLGMRMVEESDAESVLEHHTTDETDMPEWVPTFDEMLHERNVSFIELMLQLSRHLCDYLNITAFTHKRGDNAANRIEKLNPAGCKKIFSDPIYGLTWYDQLMTEVFCIRFPGLFEFDGYDMAGTLSLGPLYRLNKLSHAKLDFNGYYDPLTSRKVGLPILATMHHKTVLQMQVKGRIQNLEFYRSDEPRCYRNCIASMRVTQIEQECKCRPILWQEFTNSELPVCTQDMYQHCNVLSLGAFNSSICTNTVPCDYWDYSVTPVDYGYTEDNSTQIVFAGANTMYVVYEEQEGKTLANFLADVGGVLGLYLGASVMACIHVIVVFVKMVFLIIKKSIHRED